MKLIDRIALVLVILGGLNWGCVGIFGLDLVAALFGGSASVLSRVVYVLICLAALWSITLFFREAQSQGERMRSEKRVPQIRRHALFFSSVSDQNEELIS